jgi:F420-dependent oxidoreductase-like protein
MQIGIMVGEVRGPVGATDLGAQAAAADGLATLWTAQALGWDALIALAVAGARAPTTRLGTAVVPVRQRHPLTLASQALSVQAATGNRLTLGIGAGVGVMVTGMFGLSADHPVRYLREYLEILRPLLRGEAVERRGELITAVGSAAIPGAEPPPVLLAALGPRMLDLAGTHADGAITWMAGPRTLETHVVPRLPGTARIVAGLPVTVTDDPDDARERIARHYGMAAQVPEYRAILDREGVAGPAGVALAGDESAVARQIELLARTGITEFAAAPFGTGAEQARTTELLRLL